MIPTKATVSHVVTSREEGQLSRIRDCALAEIVAIPPKTHLLLLHRSHTLSVSHPFPPTSPYLRLFKWSFFLLAFFYLESTTSVS